MSGCLTFVRGGGGGTTFSLKIWKGRGSEKNECLRELKEFFPQMFVWRGELAVFLVKKDFVKKNMVFRAQFQMLILACLSQTTN